MDELLPPHKKIPRLSEDKITLSLIASGLTRLAQNLVGVYRVRHD
jgi:hypothetical protein